MLTPLAVETVQRGLTVIRGHEIVNGTPEPIPSPGPVDGVWGERTRTSLLAMLNRVFERQIPREQYLALQNTPPRARLVQVDMNVFALLNDASAEMPARTSRPPTPSVPTLPTSAILVPEPFPSWVLPTVLGLGAAVVVIGGGYWLYTRRRRRRR